MTGEEIAAQTAGTVTGFSQRFILDPATYVAGAGHGFSGLDFYFAGRAGVLGEVDADVVTAALVFFPPDVVRAGWDGGALAMQRGKAAAAFAACGADWADQHLADDVDWTTLAALAEKVVRCAAPIGAPLFAGWRRLAAPADAKQAALHHLNGLRELRMSRHAAAVLVTGIDVADAVRHHTPHMAEAIFGWPDVALGTEVPDRWVEAERLTNQASARDFGVLDAAEADDFVRLCDAATAAVP